MLSTAVNTPSKIVHRTAKFELEKKDNILKFVQI